MCDGVSVCVDQVILLFKESSAEGLMANSHTRRRVRGPVLEMVTVAIRDRTVLIRDSLNILHRTTVITYPAAFTKFYWLLPSK